MTKQPPTSLFRHQEQQVLCRWFMESVAVGDAIGATTEFMSIDDAVATICRLRGGGSDYPFVPVGGGWLHLPPGAHTDDTDMSLALLHGLLSGRGSFDEKRVAGSWADWVVSRPPDVGASIRAVVSASDFRTSPYAASRNFYRLNRTRCANGALMRNAVVSAVAPNLHTAFEWSLKQGIMTHYHPLSVMCCAVQVWLMHDVDQGRWPFAAYDDWMEAWHRDWTKWVSKTKDETVQTWLDEVQRYGIMDTAMDAICAAEFDPVEFNPFGYPDLHARQGWSLLSLQVAVWAMQWCRITAKQLKFPITDNVASIADLFAKRRHRVIGWIAAIGHDADTYGAIAGPMIMAACGKSYPKQMIHPLKVSATRWLIPESE